MPLGGWQAKEFLGTLRPTADRSSPVHSRILSAMSNSVIRPRAPHSSLARRLVCLSFVWLLITVFVFATRLYAAETAPVWSCRPDVPPCHSVLIVHNSWHAAIVLRRAVIPAQTILEVADFPGAEFIEFSWGDRDFFPDPNAGIWTGMRAGVWSSGSVLHLVGFTKAPREFYRGATLTEFQLNSPALAKLLDFLSAEFARDSATGRAEASPGLFADGKFYPARGKFSVLRTCNTWIAEALQTAGMAMAPAWVITAGSLQRQLDNVMAGAAN